MLRIYPKAIGKIRLKRRDRAPGKSNRHDDLHQKGNAQRNKDWAQQTTLQERQDCRHRRILPPTAPVK
ncbi:hypothetical protein GCM10009085_20100 [Pseudomonas avellanae]|nr:hypothetical protein GCM10009085_20100 [Pseudomonas avellanae]